MINDDYIKDSETGINQFVSCDRYEELKEELEKEKDLRLGIEETLKDLVQTIVEYGNNYDFNVAYPKLIEYLKEWALL